MVDLKELEERKAAKLLRSERHPFLPLTIWNYTQRTQYAGAWDEYTLMCRGLILDDEGKIVARPFPKFFNLGEPSAPPVPDEPFVVQEKLDGSLIIGFRYKDHWSFASRGSFVSEQSVKAAKLAHYKYALLDRMEYGKTYLFEVIYPSNRIVIDYGNEEALYLLAVIDNETGRDYPLSQFDLGKIVPHYPEHTDLSALPERENAEGYVVRFASGLRLKVKHPEYVRLHRLMSHATPKAVWEAVQNGVDIEEWLEGVPDEFHDEIAKLSDALLEEYSRIADDAESRYAAMRAALGPNASRKEYALKIQQAPRELQPILFAMLSGKETDAVIWKMLKPRKEDAE